MKTPRRQRNAARYALHEQRMRKRRERQAFSVRCVLGAPQAYATGHGQQREGGGLRSVRPSDIHRWLPAEAQEREMTRETEIEYEQAVKDLLRFIDHATFYSPYYGDRFCGIMEDCGLYSEEFTHARYLELCKLVGHEADT